LSFRRPTRLRQAMFSQQVGGLMPRSFGRLCSEPLLTMLRADSSLPKKRKPPALAAAV